MRFTQMVFAMMRCSQCGCEIDDPTVATLPFCSERCRMLDLGAWLNEERGLPYERAGDSTDDDEVMD